MLIDYIAGHTHQYCYSVYLILLITTMVVTVDEHLPICRKPEGGLSD